jgi:hypothetical protein
MKIKSNYLFIILGILASVHQIAAQGTAFTYEGRLNDGGILATGIYDLRFSIYDSTNTPGNLIAGPLTNAAVSVSNGLFTVLLDFGGNVFTGPDRWLEIGVRTNGLGGFSTLFPRQLVARSPYALYANSATSLENGGLRGLQVTALSPTPTYSNIVNLVAGSPINIAVGNAATVAGGGAIINGYPFPNLVNADMGTIGGGAYNTVFSGFGTVGGGWNNQAIGPQSCTVGGGSQNIASGTGSTVGGGLQNAASGDYSTVGGGYQNTASGENSTSMGYGDTASGSSSTALGYQNTAGGAASTAMGEHVTASGEASAAIGYFNIASGAAAIAMGSFAQAANNNTFVWADSQNPSFSSTTNDEFSVRAQNGVRLSDNTSLYFGATTRQMINLWGTQYAIGVQSLTTYFRTDNASPNNGFIWYKGGTNNSGYANPGGGVELMHLVQSGLYVNSTFVSSSDRNVKQDFADVSSRAILDKVAHLPIQTWAYTNDPAVKHLGPVAQDFYAAFNIGPDDKHIAVVDEGGVALAAIQGLNQKLEETRMENATLKQQNDLLAERLNELEATVKQLAATK